MVGVMVIKQFNGKAKIWPLPC